MIPAWLLNILSCPETHQPLRLAETSLVNKLNEQISAGSLKNRVGKQVTSPLDEGLIREDGKFIYAVRNNTPVMRIDEAIPLG